MKHWLKESSRLNRISNAALFRNRPLASKKIKLFIKTQKTTQTYVKKQMRTWIQLSFWKIKKNNKNKFYTKSKKKILGDLSKKSGKSRIKGLEIHWEFLKETRFHQLWMIINLWILAYLLIRSSPWKQRLQMRSGSLPEICSLSPLIPPVVPTPEGTLQVELIQWCTLLVGVLTQSYRINIITKSWKTLVNFSFKSLTSNDSMIKLWIWQLTSHLKTV